MSVIKTIELFVKNNFSKTEKETKDLNEELGKTAKAQDEVNKSFDAGATFADRYGKELEPLTTRLGEAEDRLYELALAGDTTSKEYQELLTKVGEYRKVQIETDLAVDGAATTMTQKLGSALNGVTSGFATTQGAMALFGSENEALEKSLLKVQAALAIQQGVDGLRTSYKELGGATGIATKAQAALNFVMSLNPFVLIATAIAAAIAALATFTSVLDPVIDKLKQFTDFIGITSFEEDKLEAQRQKNAKEQRKREKEAIDAAKQYREQITKTAELEERYSNSRIAQLETQKKLAQGNAKEIGKIDKQITDEKIAQLKRDREAFIEDQKAVLKQVEANIKANAAAERRIQQGLSTAGKNFYKNKKENEEAFARLQEQLRTNNFQGLVEIDNQIAAVQADATLREKNELKQRQDNYKQYRDERRRIARQIEDLENELLEEGIEKELEINRDKFRRLREDAEKNTELTSNERKKLLALFTEQEEAAVSEIRKKYYEEEKSDKVELLNFVDETNKAEVEKEKAKNLAILDNAVETNKKIIESDKAVAQAKKDIQDAQIANVEAGIALFKDLAGENNKLQALAIAAENAVGIAKIIISTQAANAAAKLKYAAIPGGLALAAAEITANKISAGIGIAASVAAAAKGIAALKQSASLDSGGGLGGDSGAGGGEVVPQFNVVGDSGINQLAQLQQPTQAFVVSGEVTSAQALDRNRVTNATL